MSHVTLLHVLLYLLAFTGLTVALAVCTAVMGYEDETGFHPGAEPVRIDDKHREAREAVLKS